MEKIQFVTGMHGNEPMPVLALASLSVKQIVANPKALSKAVRFVQKDLNASFGTTGNSYEENRAKEILKAISKSSLVIDLHTFTAPSEPFVIIVDLALKEFAASLGFKHVVYMKHNIKKGHALINYRNGVSVELGNHKDSKSFKNAIELVKTIQDKKVKKHKVKFYEVYDIIRKSGKYINFKKHKEGFIPILAGENAYKFPGLKARVIKNI